MVKLRIVKFKFIFLAVLIVSLAAYQLALAQTVSDEPYVVESNSSGEISSREIDSMAVEARQSGERLFVIVRLGTGETNRRLNSARLFNSRQYISQKSFDS